MGKDPQAESLRAYFDAQRRNNPTAPGIDELVDALDLALTDNDLIGFDAEDPDHWVVALYAKLDEELAYHVPSSDMRYVNATLHLVHQAQYMSRDRWQLYMKQLRAARSVVPEVVEPQSRCAPDNPQPGWINEGDPDDAPPHGTAKRYNNQKYKCRCKFCKEANSVYRKRLNDRQPVAEVIPLGIEEDSHGTRDNTRGSSGIGEGNRRESN